jgi:TRAP-type C4-dicarboxylate transport system substrate-binding protein
MTKCFQKNGNGKKLRIFSALMTMFLIVVMACLNPTSAAETQFKLKYSTSFFPPEPPNVQAMHALDLFEKKTDGRVKVERFMGGALGGPHEQLGLVTSGAVDIISLRVDVFTQALPLHQILCTEQLCSTEQGLNNVTALTFEIPKTKVLFDGEQKRNNIKMFYFHAAGGTGITSRLTPKSLADLRGIKTNVLTAYQRKMFKDLGWIPVNVQIPELYESLSRGLIDNVFITPAAIMALKTNEVAKSQIVLRDNSMNNCPLAINLNTWNRFPKDIQQALLDATLETARWSVQMTDDLIKNTYKKLEQSGVHLVYVEKEENELFFDTLFEHAMREWLSKTKAAGYEKEAGVIRQYWDQMKWGKWEK